MTLGLFYFILLITLICRKFYIAASYALFGVTFVSLKFGWCKENYVLQVWYGAVKSIAEQYNQVQCIAVL